jgi:hypothetical protein
VSLEQKKKAVEFWQSGVRGNRSFSAVHHRFRFVTSQSLLYRFKQQIEAEGTRNDKLKTIASYTLAEFCRAKSMLLPIHDADLRRWAMCKQREVRLDGFVASKTWLWSFKKDNNIVSRKITHFVTTVGESASK